MVNRVARYATVDWPDAAMPRTTGFAQYYVFVLGIAVLDECGVTTSIDAPDFAGWQADLRVTSVPGHQRRCPASGAHHLGATARNQLNIMDRQTNRDRPQRQAVAQLRRRDGAAHQFGAYLQSGRGDYVSLFAVIILHQGQASRPARIILNGEHCRFDAMLGTFKIHQPILLLVPMPNATRRYAAVHIPSAGTFANLNQTLLRFGLCNVAKIRIRDVTRRGRERPKCFYWHKSITFPKSATWRAEPSFLPPDGRSVIGSAGYAVRDLLRSKRNGEYSKEKTQCNRFLKKNGSLREYLRKSCAFAFSKPAPANGRTPRPAADGAGCRLKSALFFALLSA